jgi:excisionase family DNA binding protein
MRITFEIDDEDLRRVLMPVALPSVLSNAVTTKLMTIAEVAEQLGISRAKAAGLIRSGEIASISIGRARRVSPTALAEFVSKPSQPAVPDLRSSKFIGSDVRLQHARRMQLEDPRATKVRQGARQTQSRPTVTEIMQPKPTHPRPPGLEIKDWEEWRQEHRKVGWPDDFLSLLEADERANVYRQYVLGLKLVQEYLGISRTAVKRLVSDGKIREITVKASNTGAKPQVRYPVVDVARLLGIPIPDAYQTTS